MLNRIIKFSLHNRLAVVLVACLLAMTGFHVVQKMEVDVFPDLNAPTVVVMTEASGMAPEEVERLVTFPIETALNGANDVRRVRSSSTMGFSIVWVEFDWGTEIYRARQVVAEKLSAIGNEMPKNVGTPTLGPQSSILGELLFVTLTSDSTSLQDLRTLADWTIRPRLLATGGVAQVSVIGGDIKEYQILLHPGRMKQYGVALNEVVGALDAMNENTAGGILYEYGNEYIIRGVVATNDVDLLGKAFVANRNGKPVCLNAIADVKVGSKAPKMGLASHDAHPAVVMTVTKQPNTSTLELTEKLDATLDEVRSTLPADIRLNTDVYRQSRFIESSINNVKQALLEGSIFVVIVLFIFLMNLRTTLISLVTIPLSLLLSMVVLHLLGVTVNTMSLGGLCIAIGSLVDDAIVDVENVYKHLRRNARLPEGQRQPSLKVIYEASREVRMPILNSTLIIVASFLPLFFLSGMEGRMLVPLGVAFIVALFSSTLVALTLTPVLCYYGLGRKQSEPSRRLSLGERLGMRRVSLFALRHGKAILATSAVALVLALVMVFSFGRSFLPSFNEGSFTVNISTLPGISLDESDSIGRRAERALLAIPEIQTVGRKTGRAELDEHALGVNNSEIEAPFVLDGRSKDEVIADVRQRLKELPGVNIEVGSPISHRIDAMLSGTQASIAMKLFGPNLHSLYTIGNQIKQEIADVEGIEDLNVEQQVARPQLKITPKRELLAAYHISLPEFAQLVQVMLVGSKVSQVYEGNRSFDLTLKVDDESRQTIEDIRHLMVDANGRKVPLEQIAEVTSTGGPNTINRENVSRKVVISANVAGRDLRSVVNDIRERIDSRIHLPEGYHVEYGGQFESEQEASRTLMVASLLSVLLIFLLLYNQFRHAGQAAVILLNLPLALIGGVVAVALSGAVLSIPSIIGFISLFGIATRNGMLLVSRYNDLRSCGLSPLRSVIQGSTDRITPILMTALTSALALVPMVVNGDLPGNEIQSPMAKVILGGLFTSTLLNSLIIPIMYLIIEKRKS